MKSNILSILAFFTIIPTFSQVRMPAVFCDNMVLQQCSDVNIWGWASPGDKIFIVGSWNLSDTTAVNVERNGAWKSKIKTTEAGGPYDITIIGSGGHKISNVMLGEVWFCSGQSNMEWSYNHGLGNGEIEIPASNYPEIRIFSTPKIASDLKQEDCKGTWEVCEPNVMRKSSAVAYFFARQLHKKLNVPVGVIVSAWGGTNAEVWTESSIIESDSDMIKSSKGHEPLPWWPHEPGACYNTMVYPIKPYSIAGFIWYQGESNVPQSICGYYSKLMKGMIDGWRKDFEADLPFYLVQICPFNYGKESRAEIVREQQTILDDYHNTKMIIASDLIDKNTANIHPLNKWDVGDRLSNLALTYRYNKPGYSHKYPKYKSMEIVKDKAYITFSDCVGDIKITDEKANTILIAGEDKKFVPAYAKFEKGKLIVWNKKIKNIVAIRYCFDNNSIGNLFSSENLPVMPFRTDNW